MRGIKYLMAMAPLILLTGCQSYYHYDYADKYSVGETEITSMIDTISINWISGSITIKNTTDEALSIHETANRENLEDDLKVHYLVRNSTLNIQYAASGRHNFNNLQKDLVVMVPESFNIKTLDIESVSADIDVNLLTITTLDVESVSGDIDIHGDIATIDLETVSGKMNMSLSTLPNSLDMETVSGDALVYLPSNSEFKLKFTTVSGDFSTDFEMTKTSNYYVIGQGTRIFRFESVSGDLDIRKL